MHADRLREIVSSSTSREDLWCRIVNATGVATVAEIGVFKGDFSVEILARCPAISTYYMVDPWRHLEDWNKPANTDDVTFARYYLAVQARTAQWSDRIRMLRGRTVDVIDQIGDSTLDFAYIDGDHTLRGITVDMIRSYAKVRDGGWIGGDDFRPSIWQHAPRFDPTLVFPFAVHFAEAVGAEVYALPFDQFLIQKRSTGFRFSDLTGRYPEVSLLGQLTLQQVARHRLHHAFRDAGRVIRRTWRRGLRSMGLERQ